MIAFTARAQTLPPFEFTSANGHYVAKVETPRNARRPSDFDLNVYERKERGDLVKQWGIPYEHRGFATNHLVSDDGAIVVRVDDRLLEKQPLVEVFKKGQTLAKLNAEELDLHASDWGVDPTKSKETTTWLADASPSLRIYRGDRLQVLARDGGVRTIAFDADHAADVGISLRAIALREGVAHAVSVEPGIPERFEIGKERVCVDTWSVPDLVMEDEPCPVKLKGKFEIPGSQLVGFVVREDPGRKLVLLPLLGAPTAHHTVTGDVGGFDTIANLTWLRAGAYQLRIENCARLEKQQLSELEVLPAGLVAALRTTGGFAARDNVVQLFVGDVARTSNGDGSNARTFFVPDGTVKQLDRALPGELGAPGVREEAQRPPGADMQCYEITWVRSWVTMGERGSGGPVSESAISRVTRYDTTLNGAYRQVVDALTALKPPVAAVRRFVIAKDASSIRVKTGTSGLFSAFGHDHELAARDFEGEVTVDRNALEQAKLRVTVGASSLAIVDKESLGDAKEIEASARKDVLQSDRFPKITFTSTKVEVVKRDGEKVDLKITGDLDLHGTVKSITIPASVDFSGGGLRVQSSFGLKQTDYGIKPTSAAAGTVKVEDKVKLVVDLRATAQ